MSCLRYSTTYPQVSATHYLHISVTNCHILSSSNNDHVFSHYSITAAISVLYWWPRALSFAPVDEDRALCMMHDVVTDTAQDGAADGAHAPCTNHHHGRLHLTGNLTDVLTWVAKLWHDLKIDLWKHKGNMGIDRMKYEMMVEKLIVLTEITKLWIN